MMVMVMVMVMMMMMMMMMIVLFIKFCYAFLMYLPTCHHSENKDRRRLRGGEGGDNCSSLK